MSILDKLNPFSMSDEKFREIENCILFEHFNYGSVGGLSPLDISLSSEYSENEIKEVYEESDRFERSMGDRWMLKKVVGGDEDR